MRRYSSNSECVEAWYRGWSDNGQTPNENIFFEGDVIYSYGYHFPMAVLLSSGFYLVNGDTYSVTTSHHQSLVFGEIPNSRRCEIPFSALIGISPKLRSGSRYNISEIKKIRILDHEQDRYVDTGRVSIKTGKPIEQHILGACLMEYEGKKFLSGMDETGKGEGVYFLTELVDNTVETVIQALESMKPAEVKEAEEAGKEVLRQGEWFFVETIREELNMALNDVKDATNDDLKRIENYTLESIHGGTGHHVVQKVVILDNQKIFAKGVVKHTGGDHKMLKLYETGTKPKDRKWYRVYENVQVRSVRASGNVD